MDLGVYVFSWQSCTVCPCMQGPPNSGVPKCNLTVQFSEMVDDPFLFKSTVRFHFAPHLLGGPCIQGHTVQDCHENTYTPRSTQQVGCEMKSGNHTEQAIGVELHSIDGYSTLQSTRLSPAQPAELCRLVMVLQPPGERDARQ